MVPGLREQFNKQFTKEKYKAYVNELSNTYPDHLDFRIAETPVFIPKWFTTKMLDTCSAILEVILKKDYLQKSERSTPPSLRVPNEDTQPQFIAFDFGICQNANGEVEPQLIEMQAFPTLFAWHVLMPEVCRNHFEWPDEYSNYLNGYTKETYLDLLQNIIVGNERPENVILLELFPHQQ